ncbi:MAG: 16S rRNA (cytosine(967)-C(5))-methyltransferase RsmB [Pseudomonadota bacterium]
MPSPPASPAASGAAFALPLARLLDHAADAVQAVRAGRSLSDLLERVPAEARPGTQALSFHVLRWLGGAQVVREKLVPKVPPPNVDALLVSALALLWPVPAGMAGVAYAEHTVVDQAVTAARQRTPAAAGFINAVLRRFLREREELVRAALSKPLAAYNHPGWWIERTRQDWPLQWQALLAANNLHPPMVLRVNARRGDAAAYVRRLAEHGRAAQALDDTAVLLEAPCPVQQLPGFAEGEVSVQDAAAQLAARLLLGLPLPGWLQAPPPAAPVPPSTLALAAGFARAAAPQADAPAAVPPPEPGPLLRPGARVLDACAAPGGKTAHLLEHAELHLLALDSDPVRLQRVQETLNRLQLQAELKAADARDTAAWWDGRPFDAILLDAPCSASGIVRRHPDVRWLRRPDDVAALARIQAEMLDALWPLLAPGGRLVYVTCSLFRAEGQQQIDAFLQRPAGTSARLDPRSPGHLLPLPDNAGRAVHDGFYYALLQKLS